MRGIAAVTFCVCLVPGISEASVRINEIAWMGTSESYLCDWIELHNTSSTAVDIGDWTFAIDGTPRNLEEGTGESSSVPANGFLLLERVTNTCADPVPSVAGWYHQFGSIPNTGATLTLRREDGSIVDQVAGGTDWSAVGGDNESKETAQRTPAGWVTAEPTPGAENTTRSVESSDTSTTTASNTTTDSGHTRPRVESSTDSSNARTLIADTDPIDFSVDGPEYTYVGQAAHFTVAHHDTGKRLRDSLHYQWNFGDTHTTTTVEPMHTYRFPGEYVVTARASYNSYDAVARHTIKVLPVQLAVQRDAANNVLIQNTAPYELDISRFTVTGTRAFTFPARSILLPQQTVTVPRSRVEEGVVGAVTVTDRSGSVVADNYDDVAKSIQSMRNTHVARNESPKSFAREFATSRTSPTRATTMRATNATAPSVVPNRTERVASTSATASVMAHVGGAREVWWWQFAPYAGLTLLVSLAASMLVLPRRQTQPTPAKGTFFVE